MDKFQLDLKNNDRDIGNLNANIDPTKSLYFESGFKCLERGEKYSGLYGQFLSSNGRNSSHFDNIRLKFSTYVYFMVLSHSMGSKYKNSKKRFS